jgi:hypothetical protein
MKKLFWLTSLVVAAGFVGSILSTASAAQKKRASIKIINNSDWDIHHFYLSAIDDSRWGPDQLGADILESGGDAFTLSDIPCDSYDVKVVDEDDDECVVEDVDLCRDHTVWKISNKELLSCEGWR